MIVPDAGTRACERGRTSHTLPSLGIYLMIDQSDAMLAYSAAVEPALEDFVRDSPEAEGLLDLGVQYYPQSAGDGMQFCDWESYRTPLAGISPVSSKANELVTAMQRQNAQWLAQLLSPMEPLPAALRGAIVGARDWLDRQSSPSQSVVVLATPSIQAVDFGASCDATLSDAIDAAALGVSGPLDAGASPPLPIRTFVLGLGVPSGGDPDLDAIAKSGGTEQAYTVASGGSASDVANQLFAIREAASPCAVPVTATDLGSDEINVSLVTYAGVEQPFYRVLEAKDCVGDDEVKRGQWYPDTSGTSAAVHLCPTTCKTLRDTQGASLDVVTGCQTRNLL